jgi:hypothetical protein
MLGGRCYVVFCCCGRHHVMSVMTGTFERVRCSSCACKVLWCGRSVVAIEDVCITTPGQPFRPTNAVVVLPRVHGAMWHLPLPPLVTLTGPFVDKTSQHWFGEPVALLSTGWSGATCGSRRIRGLGAHTLVMLHSMPR